MSDDIEQDGTSKATYKEMLSDEQRAQLEENAESGQKESGELELTPESEQMIMGKIEDIFDKDIAFSVAAYGRIINRQVINKEDNEWIVERNTHSEEVLKTILQYGLLGGGNSTAMADSSHKYTGQIEKDWAFNTRKFKNNTIYLNILGRMFTHDFAPYRKSNALMENPIELSEYMFGKGNVIAFILDLSRFSEVNPHESRRLLEEKSHTYHIDSKQSIDKEVLDETGFALHHRVAPRFFRGMIVNRRKVFDNLEDQARFNDVDWIADIEKSVYKAKPNMLLPIYDSGGNLLWPKQMTYEEVKNYIIERDKRKSE